MHGELLLLFLSFLLNFLEFATPFLLLHDHEVLEKTIRQVLAHLLEGARRELVVVVLLVEVPVETSLKRETVHDVELSPHHDSCSLEFGLLEAEAAGMVPEFGCLLG